MTELQAAIRDALDTLPEKLKITFVLANYQKLRYREIAGILDIPVGTVKSRVSAAEKELRRLLQPWLGDARADSDSERGQAP